MTATERHGYCWTCGGWTRAFGPAPTRGEPDGCSSCGELYRCGCGELLDERSRCPRCDSDVVLATDVLATEALDGWIGSGVNLITSIIEVAESHPGVTWGEVSAALRAWADREGYRLPDVWTVTFDEFWQRGRRVEVVQERNGWAVVVHHANGRLSRFIYATRFEAERDAAAWRGDA